MIGVLQVVRDDASADWDVTLSPPEGSPVTLSPGGSVSGRVTVVPTVGDTTGIVRVQCMLLYPDLSLDRETGGVTLDIAVEAQSGVSDRMKLPRAPALYQNLPNPFKPWACRCRNKFSSTAGGRKTVPKSAKAPATLSIP